MFKKASLGKSPSLSWREPRSPDHVRSRRFSVSVVCDRSVSMLFHTQSLDAAVSELLQISFVIGNTENPALCPTVEFSRCFGLRVILLEESIVTLVVALHRRGMRAARTFHHSRNQKGGNHCAIGAAGDHIFRHDLFRAEN